MASLIHRNLYDLEWRPQRVYSTTYRLDMVCHVTAADPRTLSSFGCVHVVAAGSFVAAVDTTRVALVDYLSTRPTVFHFNKNTATVHCDPVEI